ncbi:MAG: NAD-dependent deacylase [Rhodobacteraceae bacterium]|nr:NAD-dependent deacylase [Paracoccaceae bacterium]MCY4137337.1 NAD-dependent deacylase [Paracoccaceae bacterium]
MEGTIFVLTGAGVSADSGLGTFRDADGIWQKYDLEMVATPRGFATNTDLAHDFYNARRRNCRRAEPNAAHFALAALETALPGEVVIVTQNVDNLHERAGSRNLIHMHGELMNALCSGCHHRWPAPDKMHRDDQCPRCGAPKTRPDVVFFGEYPYFMDEILDLVGRCETFASIGTSGEVEPAASLASMAKANGAKTAHLNIRYPHPGHPFDDVLIGPASEVVPAWVDSLIG